MLKKVITYTDYNGNTRTEEFCFHLSKAEWAMMEMSKNGGLAENLMPIINKMDVPKLAEFFEDLILRSYGEKTPDGKHFVKSPEAAQLFKQSEAYSELFMELFMSDDGSKKAGEFMVGLLPKEAQEEAMKEMANAENKLPIQFNVGPQ